MGAACVSEEKKRGIMNYYTTIFDNFDFRVNETDEFTFLDRARRELTGLYGPEDFMQKLYNGFRRFMIENCFLIHLKFSKKKPDQLISPLTPPPLIDEMWQLSILYTEKYRQLCHQLVGTTIHRVVFNELSRFKKVVKSIWVDYDQKTWQLDRDFTVWVYNQNISEIINKAYGYVMNLQGYNRIHIKTEDLAFHLRNIKKFIEDIQTNRNLNREFPCDIIDDHPFFNREKHEPVIGMIMKIKSALPVCLPELLYMKFSTATLTQAYIDEYARFMTMIFYSNSTLTPSEEIDQVWHIHQSLTIEYEKFCKTIYGRLINHCPTVGGRADSARFSEIYEKTLSFYRFIFRENPIIGLWPPNVIRFDPVIFTGSFVSLLRVFQSIIRVIEVHRTEMPGNLFNEVMACYFGWTGRNLFKKSKYKINLKRDVTYRDGYTTGTYWVAGGCAFVFGLGWGMGCGGGCGHVGCEVHHGLTNFNAEPQGESGCGSGGGSGGGGCGGGGGGCGGGGGGCGGD